MRPIRNKVSIEKAKQYARKYCLDNGLDTKSLDKQFVYVINDKVIFAQPSSHRTSGLRRDISTQPKPTLVVEMSQKGYTVNKTDYTGQFLSKASHN